MGRGMGPVIAPAALFGLACLHAMVFTRPALALADRYGRRVVAPAWLLALSAARALFPWACGAPYAVSWACIAGFGAPPLLVARRAVGTGRRPGSVVGVTGPVTAVLVYAAMATGILLVERGVVEGYEPPRLERAEYVGEWRGADGGVVRLKEGGEAVVEGVPAYDFPQGGHPLHRRRRLVAADREHGARPAGRGGSGRPRLRRLEHDLGGGRECGAPGALPAVRRPGQRGHVAPEPPVVRTGMRPQLPL
ncbi:hypothetical protein ACGFYQ_00720 [Streptomyces sp. NPDC048258]|uniref:hypothetical protein n=1 Tax=Streptomyces sp. NPDC048258 TaxID=3365527 RepID=UPI003710DD21